MATYEERIKAALKYAHMTQIQVAEKTGGSAANFGNRIKKGSFTVKELENIAQVLGAKFEYHFVFEDGTRI